MWDIRFSQQRLCSLLSYEALCSLRDRYVNFEGTCCFRKLPDCTLLFTFLSRSTKKDIHYAFVYAAISISSPWIVRSHDFLDKSDRQVSWLPWYVGSICVTGVQNNIVKNPQITYVITDETTITSHPQRFTAIEVQSSVHSSSVIYILRVLICDIYIYTDQYPIYISIRHR
jgi:hypothetical protein